MSGACNDGLVSNAQNLKRPFPRGWKLWVPAIGFIGLGIILLAVVPEALLQNWIPDATVEERGRLLGSAAQIVLFGLGGVIAVIGVALSLARHGQSLSDADEFRERESVRRAEFVDQITFERDRETARIREFEVQRQTELERDLRARFLAAVELLSAEAPSKRTAALYALAALGDDWLAFGKPKELQVCIDVMCGYLRSAVEDRGRTPDEGAVRMTGYDLIREHLLRGDDGSAPTWAGCRFPLSRAPIWFSVNFDEIMLAEGSNINLSMSRISGVGRLSFKRASITNGARVDMHAAKFTEMAAISFSRARIVTGGHIDLRFTSVDDGAIFDATRVHVADRGKISMSRVTVQSLLTMSGATVSKSGVVTVVDASVTERGRLVFDGTTVSDSGQLLLRDIRLDPDASLSVEGVTTDNAVFDVSTHAVIAKLDLGTL